MAPISLVHKPNPAEMLVIASLVGVLAGSCECSPCQACLAYWATYYLYVYDDTGEPVSDATVHARFRNGDSYSRCDDPEYLGSYGVGMYCIADDGSRGFKDSKRTLVVTVEKIGLETAVVEMSFRDDCCHLVKVSGPYEITLHPEP